MDDDLKRELQSLRLAIEGLTQIVMRLEERSRGGLAGAELPELTALTPRQHAALQGVVYGLDNEVVAQIMGGISVETVKTHQRQAGKKMGVSKKTELRVMGQKFLEQGTDDEYMAATGGFSKSYMLETDPNEQDQHRGLIAPVKAAMLTS